jgi:hypothetical protein
MARMSKLVSLPAKTLPMAMLGKGVPRTCQRSLATAIELKTEKAGGIPMSNFEPVRA